MPHRPCFPQSADSPVNGNTAPIRIGFGADRAGWGFEQPNRAKIRVSPVSVLVIFVLAIFRGISASDMVSSCVFITRFRALLKVQENLRKWRNAANPTASDTGKRR